LIVNRPYLTKSPGPRNRQSSIDAFYRPEELSYHISYLAENVGGGLMCGGKITYDNTDSDFDMALAIYTRLECYEPIIKREFAPKQARKPRQKMVERQ
jgi:hypothetical protein